MGPFETKSQVQVTQKISNDEAITDQFENMTTAQKDETSDEDEEPIAEDDHKSRIAKQYRDRKK